MTRTEGIGVDIVHIPRIERLIHTYPHRLEEIWSREELRYAFSRRFPAMHLAARFAAKEAVAKVLGIRPRFREIEVLREESGKPALRLTGKTREMAGGRILTISLAHERDYAIAVVYSLSLPQVGGPLE